MSKKSKAIQQEEKIAEVESQPSALVSAENQAKENKKEIKQTNSKKQNPKKKEKKSNVAVKKVKEVTSELKKVTWPSFSKVVKKTGVVLAVVAIFAVVLFGIERLLAFLFELLIKGALG